MNKPTPKINFEHFSQQKPPSNKKEGKKKKKKETKEDNSTRELRFERRKFANFLTFFFYLVLFSMFAVILVFNSRLGAINKVANQKAVDTEKIATTIQDQNNDLDTIKYESKTFLTTLFRYNPSEKEKKEREAHLQTYLGNNLEASTLLFQAGNSKRVVNDVAFINYERVSADHYTLFYNVSYTEENQPIKIGVKLTVSYKNNQFQLINLPTVTMYQENEKEPTETYDPKVYYAKGEDVSSETEKKINTFLQNFFEMYLSNDERLSLVSAVKGIGTGTLDSFTIDNLVQTGEDTYSVQGTYTFHMKEDSQLTSFYDCQIKTNKDSFFVETFN